MDPSGTPSGPATGADLGGIGIAAAVLVGPAGVGLGILGLRRAETRARRRRAIAAIVLGTVQTVVVAMAAWGWAAGHPGGTVAPTGVPKEIVISGQTVAPTYSPRPSPVYTPPPTDGPDAPPVTLAPETVRGGFEVGTVEPDADADAAGAVSSVATTYSGPRGDVQLRRSEWASSGDAADFAATLRDEAVGSLEKTGTVGVPPDGEYWYYDDEGQSTMVWTQGDTVGYATGAAVDLQMFYIQIISAS